MFSRIIEEVFPFLYFYYIANKKQLVCMISPFQTLSFTQGYRMKKIVERLESEHNRAKEIDDKTFKFTLALSISLSIISAGASGVVKFLPESQLSPYISFVFFFLLFICCVEVLSH